MRKTSVAREMSRRINYEMKNKAMCSAYELMWGQKAPRGKKRSK